MKKTILFLIFIIPVIILLTLFIYFKKVKVETNNETQGKENTKEEYIYKEDLINIGYTITEIKEIENKISLLDVKKYLLKEKYDEIINYINVPYFKCENIERYNNYKLKNKNLSPEETILYVEIGLDQEFYTNIKELENYNDKTVLINKFYKLPDDYEITDIVDIPKGYANNNQKLKKEALEHLIEMFDNAKKDNIKLNVVSSFRTNSLQNTLFTNSTKKNGLSYALTYSAKPGHSEHQTGYAVDINTTQDSFYKTKEYKWLKENSYKYGFIERYPKGKEFITGYGYEPWHYRYVGENISTKIYIEDITYEEYVIKYLK